MDLLTDVRRAVLETLRAAGYSERQITAAVEAIGGEAVARAFDGDPVAIVADRLLSEQLDAARSAHERALTSRAESPGATVVELRRVSRP